MIQPAYFFCPVCGGRLIIKAKGGFPYQVCSECKRTLYVNQFLTVSAVIVRKGKLLAVRRAQEPFKGMLDLPGGYVEPKEKARAAILRELAEELHVTGEIIQAFEVLGPDPYPYQDVIHHNGSMHYQVEIGVQKPKADDDAESVVWLDLGHLDPHQFAFPSHREFLMGLTLNKFQLKQTK